MAALAPKPALVFTGFMGAGKSRALRHAKAAGLDGVDTDQLVAERLGQPIASYFADEGEEAFRSVEAEVAQEALDGGHDAIALGGGAVLSEAVRKALDGHTVVWLRSAPDELWRRAEGSDRPLAGDEASFRALHTDREPLYRDLASAVMLSADAVPRALDALRAVASSRPARLIWAETASGDYPVWVGAGALSRVPWPAAGRRFGVTDTTVAALHGGAVEPSEEMIAVEPGESAKTLAGAEDVLRRLAVARMRRSDHVVALGGGVVGDLAGFCAATYQRGVAVVQVPTTLLAQVDSSIGGKTGVDLPEAKNYVGAYHQPAGVIADTEMLATLPPAELAAGFAEVLKTALLSGTGVWERALALDKLEGPELEELVFDCALKKVEVVASDERDSGRREALNLGHTVGHAIEVTGAYERYRHGEAVGLGLLVALRLSDAGEVRGELAAALERHGLPTSLDPAIATDDVIAAISLDKKATVAGPRYVLLKAPGEVVTGVEVDADRVRAAVEELR